MDHSCDWAISARRYGLLFYGLLEFFLVHFQCRLDCSPVFRRSDFLGFVVGPVGGCDDCCVVSFRCSHDGFANLDACLEVLEHHADRDEFESSWIDELEEGQLDFNGVFVSMSLILDIDHVRVINDLPRELLVYRPISERRAPFPLGHCSDSAPDSRVLGSQDEYGSATSA